MDLTELGLPIQGKILFVCRAVGVAHGYDGIALSARRFWRPTASAIVAEGNALGKSPDIPEPCKGDPEFAMRGMTAIGR